MDVVVAKQKVGRPRGPSRKPTLPGYFSEVEQAARLGISVSQLRRWRRAGRGPRPVSIGRHNLYTHESEAKWLAEQLAAAEQKPVRGRGRPRAA
jgi:hypothetical protein